MSTLNDYANLQQFIVFSPSPSKSITFGSGDFINSGPVSMYYYASSITNLPSGDSTLSNNNTLISNARIELSDLIANITSLGVTETINPNGLDGVTKNAGIYKSDTNINLAGILTLDGQGDSNSLFYFIATNNIIINGTSYINLQNGAQANNIYWLTIIGTITNQAANVVNSTFISATDINLNNSSLINGNIYSDNGNIIFGNNVVINASTVCF